MNELRFTTAMPHLFLDCDGVLADFDKLAREIFGECPTEWEAKHGSGPFWKTIKNYRHPKTNHGFFRSLDLMPDAQRLWDGVKHVKPSILTGCPFGKWAEPQKEDWKDEKFGRRVRMITCMARDKIKHIEKPGDVLVDDKTKFQPIWEAGGGIFVHHRSAEETLAQLKEIHPIWFERTDQWTPPNV